MAQAAVYFNSEDLPVTPLTESGIQCHLFIYIYVVNQAAPPNRGQCISDFFLASEEGTFNKIQ